jgi:hypothetical protein
LEALLLENVIRSLGVVFGGGWSVVVASVSSPRWGLSFLFLPFLFFSWLCVSLLSFDVLLVQMVGVIGIFAILIYFLYRKICKLSEMGNFFFWKWSVALGSLPPQTNPS